MSVIAASGGKRAQITVSLRSPWQRLHWWASLTLRQRRNHKSSLVCILNNESLILKFVDSTMVEAFIHASPLNSSRRLRKKIRKSFLFLPALFSVLLQKCSLYFWAGWRWPAALTVHRRLIAAENSLLSNLAKQIKGLGEKSIFCIFDGGDTRPQTPAAT